MALEKQYHDELRLELEGAKYSGAANEEKEIIAKDVESRDEFNGPDIKQAVDDIDNLSKVVMSRKKRRLYEAMTVKIFFRPNTASLHQKHTAFVGSFD